MRVLRARRTALAALLLAVLASSACVASASTTLTESAIPASTPTDRTGSSAVEPPAPPQAAPAGACRYLELDAFGDIQIEVEFVSAVEAQADTSVDYVLFDDTGAVLASSNTFVEDLLPGERVRIAVDTGEDAPNDPAAHDGITCELVEIVPIDFGDEPFRAQPGDSCRFVELDRVGDIQIEIEIIHPLDVPGDLVIDYALRAPDGTRFGDGLAFTETADPGERVVQQSDTFTGVPDWMQTSDVTCEILSIQDF